VSRKVGVAGLIAAFVWLGLELGAAQAATFTPYPTSNAILSQLAAASGVSASQAQADVALQRSALDTIQALIAKGDTVNVDDTDATIDVVGSIAPVAVPPSVASRIVQEKSAPVMNTASISPTPTTSCAAVGGNWLGYTYCVPVQPGGTIARTLSGAPGVVFICTAGWVVETSAGYYTMTAGHCGDWGTTWYSQTYLSTGSGGSGCSIGSSIGGNSPWGGYDFAYEPVSGGSCSGDWAYIHENGTDVPQQGAVTPFGGEYVCHQGATSGFSCGQIPSGYANTNIIEIYDGSNYVIHNADVVCGGNVAGGDSGGPGADETYLGAATGIVITGRQGVSGTTYSPCAAGQSIWTEEDIQMILTAMGGWVFTS